MKWVLVLSFVVFSTLQVTWLPHIRPFGVMPDLVLVELATLALLMGGVAMTPFAVFGGLLLDLGAGTPLGLSAVALLVALLAIGWWRGIVLYFGVGLYIFAAAVATVAYDATILVGMQTLHERVDWPAAVIEVIGPSVLVNSALAIPLAYLFGSLARRFGYNAAIQS